MALAVAATWTAKPGESDRIRKVLTTITPLCREEPDVILYQPHVSADDPHVFFIYEVYTGAEGFAKHRETAHFQEHVVNHALEHLADRQILTWETLDG